MTTASQTQSHQPGTGSALIYNLLMLLLFPITLVGYLIWLGALMLNSRKDTGISVTAQGPLSARWTQHNLGVRPDEPASRLLLLMPGIPPLGLALTSWPMLTAHRLSGYVPKTFRYPYEGDVVPVEHAAARQTFFDRVLEQHLPAIPQLVILGAGFDTRAYLLPKDWAVRSFEVDMPATQAAKRDLLAKAGIDAGKVTFVPADFEKDDWLALLVEAGFDVKRPALFLWEGVIIYLNRDAVLDTLRKVARTASGSLLAFDYFTTETLTSNAFYWRFARATTKSGGEPLTFGIDSTPPSRDRVAELLGSCGLALDEQQTLGQETGDKRAWGGFAVGRVS